MPAFDKIESGFPTLDEILDYIRIGDNVVWQVSNMKEFKLLALPFVDRAIANGKKVNYIRFSQNEALLPMREGVEVSIFDPEIGFEAFTVAIHNKITAEGKEAFYVFDCLSELQSAWYTDLMMGNFFCVTCPYLFELDTVAYFPLIRGRHSFDTIARIRDTTQILLDIASCTDEIFLHPLKVWNRYSNMMFLPHRYIYSKKEFVTVEDGVGMSKYYQNLQCAALRTEDQNFDSHDRFFNMVRMEYQQGRFKDEHIEAIIVSTMTRDKRLKGLVKEFFSPYDYFLLRDRMIGSGSIGGKACGMLLARKIAEKEVPEFREHNEPHDSFYIGSDVFYTYVVTNGLWKLRLNQRSEEGYFKEADELGERLLSGSFPAKIKEQFQNVLDYFGQSPFIVRSSSLLEDGFGNAFAGKYESVFCVNQGEQRERMEAFEAAVKRVYASTMNASALEYRIKRGLNKKDEQMAVLVQRVSGAYFGRYFMPNAAGVGYSRSAYKWYPDMDMDAGMLRLVIGLGTKAVDRTGEDYPRLASLDRPAATVHATVEEKHRYSQRYLDVLDCKDNLEKEIRLDELLPLLPRWYKLLLLEHDTDAEQRLRQTGRRRDVFFVSCQRLLEKKEFTVMMQKLLKTLERVYGNPVDIEYTVNMDETGAFVMNLLQCRPLYQGKKSKQINATAVHLKNTLFDIRDSSMGPSGIRTIDVVVHIDPEAYYNYPYALKYDVANAVGKINQYYRDKGKELLLLTPGRIGTSSPELGVPVTFGDISNFSVLCEVSDSRAGYMPELSYGSHMFQDLVEAEILYCAIWNNEKTKIYSPELILNEDNIIGDILPELENMKGIIHITETPGLKVIIDSIRNICICGLDG